MTRVTAQINPDHTTSAVGIRNQRPLKKARSSSGIDTAVVLIGVEGEMSLMLKVESIAAISAESCNTRCHFRRVRH